MSWSPTRSNTHFRRRKGQVEVTLRSASRCVVLEVADNGVGFPVNLDFRSPSTLGLKLVAIFTEQVGGTMELTREEGRDSARASHRHVHERSRPPHPGRRGPTADRGGHRKHLKKLGYDVVGNVSSGRGCDQPSG